MCKNDCKNIYIFIIPADITYILGNNVKVINQSIKGKGDSIEKNSVII